MSAFALILYGPWNHPALAGTLLKEGNGHRELNGKGVQGEPGSEGSRGQSSGSWNRRFLGYAMTHHRQPRLKVSAQSVERFKGNLKALFWRGRGQALSKTIVQAMPVLRGWLHYFRLAETKGVFEALDG